MYTCPCEEYRAKKGVWPSKLCDVATCKEDEEFRASMQRIREQFVARNAGPDLELAEKALEKAKKEEAEAEKEKKKAICNLNEKKDALEKAAKNILRFYTVPPTVLPTGPHGSSDEPTPEPQPSKRPRKEFPPTPSATSDSA